MHSLGFFLVAEGARDRVSPPLRLASALGHALKGGVSFISREVSN